MKRIIPCVLGLLVSLLPSTVRSQNVPPIAINDTVYMCSSTITIYVQQNDTNPDGDSLVLSIYAGSINGSFSVNGNAIDYTPNVGFSGTDTLIYSLCDDGVPPLCDTAVVIIHVGADYFVNDTASICSGDSIFLGGAWQNTAGSYIDWMTSIYGCDSVVTTELIVNPVPVATITASGSLSGCGPDSVTLTANPADYYLWSTGDTTQSIVVYTPGNYSVSVSDTNGCASIDDSITINVVPPPTATITPSGSTTLCQGDVVTLTASSGDSWLWSTGATTQAITVGSAGTYWVIISNGTCVDTASINVTVTPAPVATITPSGPTTFCSGDSVLLSASAGGSWLWSTGATSQTITVENSGTYWVIVTNGSCSDTSASVTVTVTPAPVATITPSGPTTLCQGDQVTLTASSGSSWLWSTGVTTQSITVVSSGNYWVIVSNGNGCSDTSAVTTVIVNPLPVAVVNANGPTTFCEGDSVILTSINGSSWLWSNGSTSQSIIVTDGGSYSVTVTDANGCSATSANTVVTVNEAPQAGITANGPTDLCNGETVTLTAVNGTSWLWSNGATTQSITVNSAGTYYVVCTNQCGSDTSSSVAVSVTNGLPVASIGAAQAGYTYTFTDNSTGGPTSWSWNFGDNGVSSEQNPVHEYGGPGPYVVTLIVSNACGSDTTSMLLDIADPKLLGLYNAFSPNGDGFNDTWNVPMLEFYSDNTVTIVNRWGSEVWKASAYDNDQVVWNGKNLEGDELPDGTYYYIITYGGEEQRGWVFIKR